MEIVRNICIYTFLFSTFAIKRGISEKGFEKVFFTVPWSTIEEIEVSICQTAKFQVVCNTGNFHFKLIFNNIQLKRVLWELDKYHKNIKIEKALQDLLIKRKAKADIMKTKKVIIDARRDALLKELKTAGHLTVDELVERLHVSPLTIRRDLQYLNDHGFIDRFYGGASIINFVGTEHDPASSNEPYKHAIAKYAAQYVKDNDVLFINTSSTALLLLSYIKVNA